MEQVLHESALIGTVINVEHVDMPDLGDQKGHNVMAYYGLGITTEKGQAIIDFRNDSNGYYGGYLLLEA